VDTKYFGTLSR